MRSRRVPVLKLGSRGPGGDARSLRCVRKAFAKRSQASADKIVAKRRTVVTFYVSPYKTVNNHRDRGGPGRETQNCRHFWTRLASPSQKCQQSQGSGGSWSRNPELSSLLDSSRVSAVSKLSTITGIGGVLVAKRSTVVTFGLVLRLRVSKVSTFTGIGGVLVAKRSTVVTFGLALGLRVSNVSTITGIGGVLVAQRSTVVTFGLVSRLRVSKVSTITGIGGGGRGRETQHCRHFWTRLASPRLKSVNDSSRVSAVSKLSTITGIGGVLVAKPRTVLAFGLASGKRRGERRKER